MTYFKMLMFFFILFYVGCNTKEENKIKIDLPQALSILSPEEYVIFFYDREIDEDLTPNCGVASPATTVTTGATGTTGGTSTTSPVTGKFTIVMQLFMKLTGESLAMRFLYDPNQSQGSIDQQQGFTFTGGVFNNTVSGKQGTVEWGLGGLGIGYIDESSTTAQTLSFFNLKIRLNGYFQKGESTSTTPPIECYTSDNINCTTIVTGTKCFTRDNQKCLVITTEGTPVFIQGTLKCNSSRVIPGT